MKICICSSLVFASEVQEVAKMLEKFGHEVLMPSCLRGLSVAANDAVDRDYRAQVDLIRAADVVLVCNFLKDCTPGYIGANTFAELYVARYFEKPIYTLFPLPENPYIAEELRSFDVQVLDYDLSQLPISGWWQPSLSPVLETPAPAPEKPSKSEKKKFGHNKSQNPAASAAPEASTASAPAPADLTTPVVSIDAPGSSVDAAPSAPAAQETPAPEASAASTSADAAAPAPVAASMADNAASFDVPPMPVIPELPPVAENALPFPPSLPPAPSMATAPAMDLPAPALNAVALTAAPLDTPAVPAPLPAAPAMSVPAPEPLAPVAPALAGAAAPVAAPAPAEASADATASTSSVFTPSDSQPSSFRQSLSKVGKRLKGFADFCSGKTAKN